MSLIEKINHIFFQRKPLKFYILITIIINLIGIFFAIVIPMSFDILGGLTFNKTAVNYQGYHRYLIDSKSISFEDIFLNNLFVSFFLLFAPLLVYLVPISFNWLIQKKVSQEIEPYKGLVKFIALLLALIVSFHTFVVKDTFIYFLIVPPKVFYVTYIHGIFEFAAFILSSSMSLYFIDQISHILFQVKDSQKRNEEIKKIICYIVLLIFTIVILIACNAFWEANITPKLIISFWSGYIT